MTKQHPLTDDICEELTPTYPLEELNYYMRAAADWQLERVIKWLYDNLDEYSTDTDPGFFWPMSRLLPDLEKAMRPQENS